MSGDQQPVQLWERQPGETPRQFEYFLRYREMGRKRTVETVSKLVNKSASHLYNLSAEHHWKRRSDAWDREQDRLWELDQAEGRRTMARRHAALAVSVQQKIIEALKTLDTTKMTASDLARMLEVATRLERVARGEPTAILAHTGKDGGPIQLENLSPEEAAARTRELFEEAKRRGLLEPSGDDA